MICITYMWCLGKRIGFFRESYINLEIGNLARLNQKEMRGLLRSSGEYRKIKGRDEKRKGRENDGVSIFQRFFPLLHAFITNKSFAHIHSVSYTWHASLSQSL